jgi:NAD(P)-dependent dehydrogenase (short-subunit alcohol dehydrogenase family)
MCEPTDLTGRVVLVTGASRGLGAALARAFSATGASVAISARTVSSLEALAEEIRRGGGRCHVRSVDVRDAHAVERWVRDVARELGGLHTLVNNASVLDPRVPLVGVRPEDWTETLAINLTGPFLTARVAAPIMAEGGGGSIINVSSGAAIPPRREWGAYAVSKHALEGLSRNLAAELDGTGVRVNCVDPGAMRTGMRAAAYPDENPEDVLPPAEVAGVFLWLASEASRGVTGSRFRAADWTGPPA